MELETKMKLEALITEVEHLRGVNDQLHAALNRAYERQANIAAALLRLFPEHGYTGDRDICARCEIQNLVE